MQFPDFGLGSGRLSAIGGNHGHQRECLDFQINLKMFGHFPLLHWSTVVFDLIIGEQSCSIPLSGNSYVLSPSQVIN